MALEKINQVNLSGVTTATNGAAVFTGDHIDKTIFVNVSVNTGAVTVSVQASHNGTTWFSLDSKTYTAVTGTDVFSYNSYYPYMRTLTSTQSNSTVTTNITARGV